MCYELLCFSKIGENSMNKGISVIAFTGDVTAMCFNTSSRRESCCSDMAVIISPIGSIFAFGVLYGEKCDLCHIRLNPHNTGINFEKCNVWILKAIKETQTGEEEEMDSIFNLSDFINDAFLSVDDESGDHSFKIPDELLSMMNDVGEIVFTCKNI